MQTTRQVIEAARDLETNHNQIAEKMLSVLQQYEGKKLTRRVLPKLSAALGQDVILNDYTAGLLYLETEAYRRDREGCGFDAVKLFIPTAMGQTTLPVIDCEQIRERNSCYLEAAIERNFRRDAELASTFPEMCDDAANAYRKAEAELEQLTEYPCPDRHQIQKQAGMI